MTQERVRVPGTGEKNEKTGSAACYDTEGQRLCPSEQYPEKYHGVSKFDRVTGAPLAAKKEDFSAFFGKELCALAEKDNRICAITAAMRPARV